MKTLDQHLDALDAMVTNHAATPEIRSQIAFIQREVAALETDYVSLSDSHAKLQQAHSELEKAHTKLKQAQHDKGMNALLKQAEDYQKMLRSKELRE